MVANSDGSSVPIPISKRSSPLHSAEAPFRRLGSSRSGTDAPERLPLSFATQERLFVFLSAALPGSQRDSPRPTHANAQGSRTKDTHPPCDGILRRLRRLRIARCPAGIPAAVEAGIAGVGCCNDGRAYCGGSQGRWYQRQRHQGISAIGASLPIGEIKLRGRSYPYISGK